jgi:hypothetical protein
LHTNWIKIVGKIERLLAAGERGRSTAEIKNKAVLTRHCTCRNSWHATLVKLPREDGSYHYRIVDGKLNGKPSLNGLLVNGDKLQAHNLENGDVVVWGVNTTHKVTSHLHHPISKNILHLGPSS